MNSKYSLEQNLCDFMPVQSSCMLVQNMFHLIIKLISFVSCIILTCEAEEEGNTVLLELCAVHGTLTAHFEMTKKISFVLYLFWSASLGKEKLMVILHSSSLDGSDISTRN